MATPLRKNLVFEVHAGDAHSDQPFGNPRGIHCIPATRINVRHHRDVGGLRDIPREVEDVFHLHQADVGLAQQRGGEAVAGDLNRLEA
jgi:hypothetical protein